MSSILGGMKIYINGINGWAFVFKQGKSKYLYIFLHHLLCCANTNTGWIIMLPEQDYKVKIMHQFELIRLGRKIYSVLFIFTLCLFNIINKWMTRYWADK